MKNAPIYYAKHSPSTQNDQVLDLADIHRLSIHGPLLPVVCRVLDGQSNNLAVHFQECIVSYSVTVKRNQSTNNQDSKIWCNNSTRVLALI